MPCFIRYGICSLKVSRRKTREIGCTPSFLMRINLGPHKAGNTLTRRISVELIQLHLVELDASTQNILQPPCPCLRHSHTSVYAVPDPHSFILNPHDVTLQETVQPLRKHNKNIQCRSKQLRPCCATRNPFNYLKPE